MTGREPVRDAAGTWSATEPSLRRILFAALAVVVVVVAGSMLIPALLQERRNERHLAAEIVHGIQQQVVAEARQSMAPLDHQVRIDLDRIRAGQLPRGHTKELKDVLLPTLRNLRGVESMMVGDDTGYQLLLMHWTPAAAASPLLAGRQGLPQPVPGRRQYFTREYRLAEWGKTSKWQLWDPSGQAVEASWEVELPDYDPRQRPWLRAALDRLAVIEASGSPESVSPVVWTDVYALFTTKVPGLSVSGAARAPDGRPLVVAYDLELDDLCTFTQGLEPMSHGCVFLCTGRGEMIALPRDPRFADSAERRANLMKPIGELGIAPLAEWERHWRRRGGELDREFMFEADADSWWGAWQPFPLGNNEQLWLGVVVPRRDLTQLVGYDRSSYIVLVIAAFAAALLLANWFSWLIARPLHQVVTLSRRIGAMDLTDEPPPQSRIVELQLLIEALVTMRSELREHIAARERSAEAIAGHEARFRTMFDLAAVGLVLAETDGRMLAVNDEFCRMVGYSPAALADLRIVDITWPEDRDADLARIRGFLDRSRPDETLLWQKRLRHRDGHVVLSQTGVRVLPRANGGGRNLVITFDDVTERVSLEQQLRQSQRLEAVGRLAGGVAHDFNNLLTVILGHLAIARRSLPNHGAVLAELSAAEHAVSNGADLVRQLLTFARRDHPVPRVVDVGERLLRGQHLVRRLLREDIHLVMQVDHGPHPVLIDPTQLQQVVVNLVLNSRDAIAGSGTVAITVDRREREGRPYVELVVRDDGAGMGEEVLAHAFDPFYSTKPTNQGSGLGLASCLAIVEQAGGKIAIASTIGAGTTVTILLPASAEAAVVEPAQRSPAAGGGETILFVEDEPAIRKVTERALRASGYRVFSSASADEALRVMADRPRIDLLLTDVVMPGMNGGELARRLCRELPGMRVLFLSGYAADALDDRIPPAAGLLQKPFTSEELLQRVREVLDRPAS